MVRLGLSMIVKNEAPVIERCLRSLRPVVDWWVVADTGSSDGTQDLVRAAMDGVPGVLLERPWVGFGPNRQESLDAARALPASDPDDYVLWIDADEQLVGVADPWAGLAAGEAADGDEPPDGYHLTVEYDATRYARLAAVRLGRPWRWTGVIHEYLELPGARVVHLDAPRIKVERAGARSRDPDVYRKDAALIETELVRTPDDPRLQFYLAQSWRDAGEPARALEAYRRRAANDAGWDQERWYALFQVGACLERLAAAPTEISEAYLAAYALRPDRAEPLVELARHERLLGRFEVALLYARPASLLALPGPDALFVDVDTYQWRAWDEVAVSAYWCGRGEEGRAAAERALAARPDDARLRANLGYFE